MGREIREVTVRASLDDHGGKQDAADNASWDDLVAEMKKLTENSKYADIKSTVWEIGD